MAAVREAVGPVARAARGRQPRLVGGAGGAARSARSSRTTSSSWSSPAAPSRSCARCAAACPRRSPPTSRSARRAPCAAPIELEACDAVNVKLAGARRLQARARGAAAGARARRSGAFLSSTLDGPWGIAAALQLAASEDVTLACGLATLDLFDAPLARALPAPAQRHAAGAAGPRAGRGARRGALAEVARRGSRAQPRPRQLGSRAAGAAARGPRSRDDRRLAARQRRRPCAGRRARSRSSRAPATASSGSSSVSSSRQTGSSTPWPAVRSSSASVARVVGQAAGALRLHERLGLVGEQRLALPERHDVLDRRGLHPGRQPLVGLARGRRAGRARRCRRWRPTVTSARVAAGVAQRGAQRQAAAERVAHEHARRPPPRRSRPGAPRGCARGGRAGCSDSVRRAARPTGPRRSPRCMKPGMKTRRR